MFSLATVVMSLLAATLARPQYGRSTAQSHTIVVGGPNGELTFSPEAIAANVGDSVIFEFHQKNHSATQSSFASPCGHLAGGFDAGFNPVAANVTSGFPTFTYTVADTKPIWVFCAQGGGAHCAAGMVFAINCGADGSPNSFTNFKAAAMATAATSSSAYGYGSAPATTAASDSAALPDTTSYPGVTIPPAEVAETVTSTVVVGSSTWTTTYASYPNSPDPTPSSLEGSVIKVTVGANGLLRYDPPKVVAKPRDTIMFEFHAKNHTATQSSFADPCRKLSLTANPPRDSFDSGFFPTAADATTFSTWNLTINDTAPIWVYCRQAGHCGMGMVLAINSDEAANSTHTFSAFQTLAMEINGTTTSNTSSAGATGLPGAPSGSSKVTASLVFGAVSALVGVFLL